MGSWPLITNDQLDLSTQTFDFTQDITDTLGNLGTEADGFDALVNETLNGLQASGDPATFFDEDLNTATQVAGTIDPNSLNADAASLPASLAAGDEVVREAQALLGSTSTPGTPGKQSTPACSQTIQMPPITISRQNSSIPVTYTNKTRQTVTITDVVWEPDASGFWSHHSLSPLSVPPGGTYSELIAIAPKVNGKFQAKLTIYGSDPAMPIAYCFIFAIGGEVSPVPNPPVGTPEPKGRPEPRGPVAV